MRNAKILTYVQLAIVALCYMALIAAAVIKLSGGNNDYVVAFGLLGTVLGFGSLIPGRLAKRAVEAEANPFEILARTVRPNSERAPTPPVHVTIHPVPGKLARYTITIHNATGDVLVNGSLDHSRLLHPGQFGLDDTHMPNDIWIQPPVQFEKLAPGGRITFEVDGYDVPKKFDCPKETRTTLTATRVKDGTAPGTSENLTASVRMAW